MTERTTQVQAWLDQAKEAREARDRWRSIGPTLLALHAAGVPFQEIQEYAGISPATAHGLIMRTRLSSSTTDK